MRADIPLGVDAKAAFLMSLLLSDIESVSVGVAGSHRHKGGNQILFYWQTIANRPTLI